MPRTERATANGERLSSWAALVAVLACAACSGSKVSALFSLATPAQDTLDFGQVYVGADREKTAEIRASGTGTVNVSEAHLEGSCLLYTSPSPRD